ncbi:MAG: flippase-like domain-containing protein [Defluviitaleaceae bacterium]|nr:flippase-like domain-containing protein [Defluviitaleaceae bacterium]MCL2262920.1 flippase-like domain-containing protein [Defluviitaleaceae bacterium]
MKKKILIAVIVTLMLIALSQLDAEGLLYGVAQIPVWVATLLFALQIATQFLINWQWYEIAKAVGIRVSFWAMFYVNCKGAVVDSITPGVKIGGEVTRAVQLKREGACTTEQAAAIVAVQKLFSMGALFLVMGFAVGWWVFIPFLIIFLCVFFVPHRIKNYVRWNFLITLCEQVENIRGNKRLFVPLFLLSLCIWLLYPAKMYILVLQFATDVSFFNAAAITFAAYMVAMLPIFPGGLGGFEATMTGLLAATGVAVASAAVITVLFRFVTFWFVMLFGAGYIALYKKVLPTLRDL